MSENLMCKGQKSSSRAYCEGWKKIYGKGVMKVSFEPKSYDPEDEFDAENYRFNPSPGVYLIKDGSANHEGRLK